MAARPRRRTLAAVNATVRFRDRQHAGRELADALAAVGREQPVVIGLPRGGVVVAYEVAVALDAPLDVAVVRKLGAPLQPEYAIGAIGEDDAVLLNERALVRLGLRTADVDAIVTRERVELERRVRRYRGARAAVPIPGRTVVLVDDGVATGSTAGVAIAVLRHRGASRIVLAVPVGPPDVRRRFAGVADEVVCLETPEAFSAVGAAYQQFGQTSDAEVERLLRSATQRPSQPPRPASLLPAPDDQRAVMIPAGAVDLPGVLGVANNPRGLVVFAHGSGSSRHSSRNLKVARALRHAGFATLLFDLLTEREAADRGNVFDIALLAGRLVAATRFAASHDAVAGLPVGYFGASTGAAAALTAAAELGSGVRAVVSRGGRPDLAGDRLGAVTAATLLIVGGDDQTVLALNQQAAARLHCRHRIAVVAAASHLFAEPGALERVSELAGDWFGEYLAVATPA
jgi:putative phosphoribosyl transferase